MNYTITEAETIHSQAIAKLLGQLGYTTSEVEAQQQIEYYKNPSYKLLVAIESEQVIGFIALHTYTQFHIKVPIGRITSFCVDENKRGTGAGNTLLAAAEIYFENAGCYKIEVTSNKRRIATHEYYLHRGYTQTSEHFIKLISSK
jgi:N-acetylglutamate synthase-like GNAT family acetyltransferase